MFHCFSGKCNLLIYNLSSRARSDSRNLRQLDQAGGLAEAEAVDLLEGGGGLPEVTAVHVAPGEVGHLPVHPGHGRAHVGAQLKRHRLFVGVVHAKEGHRSVGWLKLWDTWSGK